MNKIQELIKDYLKKNIYYEQNELKLLISSEKNNKYILSREYFKETIKGDKEDQYIGKYISKTIGENRTKIYLPIIGLDPDRENKIIYIDLYFNKYTTYQLKKKALYKMEKNGNLIRTSRKKG